MKYLVKLRRVVTQEVEIEIDSDNLPVENCLDAMSVAEDVVKNLDQYQLQAVSQIKDGGWVASSVKQ